MEPFEKTRDPHDANPHKYTHTEVKQIISSRFTVSGNPAQIPKIRGGIFTANMTEEGIYVDNLANQPFLPWRVFFETVDLLIKQDGRAPKGDAMKYRLGDLKLSIDSIEGHVAQVVYNKGIGSSVFRRITPIGCILIWAGLCRDDKGYLMLVDR